MGSPAITTPESLSPASDVAHVAAFVLSLPEAPPVIHIALLFFEKLHVFEPMFLEPFSTTLRAVLKVPVFTILMRHQPHLCLPDHDYHGVINVNREDVPEERKLYKQASYP